MTARSVVIGRDGRAKAYRPLPAAERAAALAEGLAAYDRGDFFEAHELLEPAWMGTADAAERDLLQGLIKLAAAFVHDVRGNPLGLAKNLTGACERLAAARDAQANADGVELAALVEAIEARLRLLAADPRAAVDPPPLGRTDP